MPSFRVQSGVSLGESDVAVTLSKRSDQNILASTVAPSTLAADVTIAEGGEAPVPALVVHQITLFTVSGIVHD